eukprot:1007149-Pyramimonas_sp.AAC.2
MARAFWRSAGVRRTLRELMASPSASRTNGIPITSTWGGEFARRRGEFAGRGFGSQAVIFRRAVALKGWQVAYRKVQVLDHLRDDAPLLVVFFAENGHIWVTDVEELCHHGGHPPEEDRPALPAQWLLRGCGKEGSACGLVTLHVRCEIWTDYSPGRWGGWFRSVNAPSDWIS